MRACLRPVVVAASLVAPLTLGAAWAAAAGPSTGAAPTSTTIVAVAPTITVAPPATPASIIAAAFQQTLSAPSQFALYADIAGTSVDLTGDRPLAAGVITPDGVSVDIDLAPLFGLLGIEVTDVDTHVEVMITGPGVFVRAPLIGALAADFGGASGPFGPLASLGDGWGFISFDDLASTGDDVMGGSVSDSVGVPSDFGSLLGMLTADPALLQAVFDSVPITELGTDTIDGVAATGYELLLPDDSGSGSATSGSGSSSDTAVAAGTPVEVWIGDDGYIHRIALRVDGDTLDSVTEVMSVDVDDLGSVGDVATAAESGLGDLAFVMRVDFSGYGATDIVVAPPTDYIDLVAQPKP